MSERQRTGTTTLEATFRILMLYNVKVESSLDVPMGGGVGSVGGADKKRRWCQGGNVGPTVSKTKLF